jgi:hypothetical protein
MLLAFILLIMVLLHVQFFVRNILFGTDEVDFFIFTIRYLFDKEVARTSLYFSVSCALAFATCYLVAHRLGRSNRRRPRMLHLGGTYYSLPLWPLISAGVLQVLASFNIVIQSGFEYQAIAEQFGEGAFILELRVIFLLFLSHLLLNVRMSEVMTSPHFKTARIVTYLYILAALLMQARSRVFEVAALICFTTLMWQGDKIRLKYFIVLGLALIAPNIIVLGRLGWPEDFSKLVDGLFSFEYSVLFNNLLSASIQGGPNLNEPYTFSPSLSLLLPSPIRSLLGIEIVKSDYYTELSELANIRSGGFSLLAELFTNFGWSAIWVLGALGALIGYLNARAMRVTRASMLTAAAPLLYTAFILAFRNDLGVFIKYTIQLLVIAMLMTFTVSLVKASRQRRDT